MFIHHIASAALMHIRPLYRLLGTRCNGCVAGGNVQNITLFCLLDYTSTVHQRRDIKVDQLYVEKSLYPSTSPSPPNRLRIKISHIH